MDVQELVNAVKEAVDERLAPITERIEALESAGKSEEGADNSDPKADDSAEGTEDKDEDLTPEERQKLIDDAVKAAIDPLVTELETLKAGVDGALGSRKSIDTDEVDGRAIKSGSKRDAWGRKVRS